MKTFGHTRAALGRYLLVIGVVSSASLLPTAAKADLSDGFIASGSMVLLDGKIQFAPGTFVIVKGSQTGEFIGLSGGKMQKLPPAVDTPVTENNFIRFSGSPLSLTLTDLLGGVDGSEECFSKPAVGQTCSLRGSPFNFLNGDTDSDITSTLNYSVTAVEVNRETGANTSFIGMFSTTYDVPFQSILDEEENDQPVKSSFFVTFTETATPEPGFMLPLAAGVIILLGATAFRRRARV